MVMGPSRGPNKLVDYNFTSYVHVLFAEIEHAQLIVWLGYFDYSQCTFSNGPIPWTFIVAILLQHSRAHSPGPGYLVELVNLWLLCRLCQILGSDGQFYKYFYTLNCIVSPSRPGRCLF